MIPSSPAKIGLAFAAGLVVALGSVMIYVKTTGLGVRDTAATAAVQLTQPESLNAGKVEAPAAQRPAPVSAPTAEAPAPPAAARPLPVAPELKRTTARRHYQRRSTLPESQSTIRVEVSQMKPADLPPGAPVPLPVAAPPVRPVTENPSQAAPQPAVAAPRYSAPVPPPPQPHTVTLPVGTNVVVRLAETISTNQNYSGDTFRATLDRPIILDGFVIAEKGSKVLGKIVAADKAGKFEGAANLQMTVTEISTTDGQRVRIETGFFNKKGPSNSKEEAAKIGGGAVLGAIIGALAGGGRGAAIGAGAGGAAGTGAVALGKGKPAVVSSETQLTFQLTSPTTITERLN
jgi:hypothetical protein